MAAPRARPAPKASSEARPADTRRSAIRLRLVADDNHLVEKARKGDRRALEALLEKHLAMVYRFVATRMGRDHADLEDVVQETLISAAASIASLRAEHDGAVPKWLLVIARHKVADHFRRSLAHPQSSLDGEPEANIASAGQDVQEMVTQRDSSRHLRELLRDLTPEQEEVLVLRFVLGYGGKEVAAITGRTLEAVKALQHRGLATLQTLVGQAEDWR